MDNVNCSECQAYIQDICEHGLKVLKKKQTINALDRDILRIHFANILRHVNEKARKQDANPYQ